MILIYVKTLIMLMISHNNDLTRWETDNINTQFSFLEQARDQRSLVTPGVNRHV